MRIALLQLGSRLADPEANGRAIEQAYRSALDLGALGLGHEALASAALAGRTQPARRAISQAIPCGSPRRQSAC